MEIKPCPICGGSVRIDSMYNGEKHDKKDFSSIKSLSKKYYYTCENGCFAKSNSPVLLAIFDTEEEAVSAWNKLAEHLENNYKKKKSGKEELYDKITKSTIPCTLTALKSSCELIAKYCSMLATVEHDEIKGWYNGQACAYKTVAEWVDYIISIKDTI